MKPHSRFQFFSNLVSTENNHTQQELQSHHHDSIWHKQRRFSSTHDSPLPRSRSFHRLLDGKNAAQLQRKREAQPRNPQ